MNKLILTSLLSINITMASERFTNTNNIAYDKSFKDLMKWTFTSKNQKKVQIETSTQWQELDSNSKDYAVWIGHATYLINSGGISVLTDPVFSKRSSPLRFTGPKRLIPPAILLEELPKIDVITVSHNHYDHLDIVSLKKLHKLNPEAKFLVPSGDKRLLVKSGIENVQEFLWWENIEIEDAIFTFTPVQHWSARGLRDRNKSLWGGWFMQLPEYILYHAGDTGYSRDFAETKLRLGSPDYALIPIGAYDPQWFMSSSHVTPLEAVKIAQDLGAKQSFAMHWGTFLLTDEEVLEPPFLLRKAMDSLNLKSEFFKVLKPGEIARLN